MADVKRIRSGRCVVLAQSAKARLYAGRRRARSWLPPETRPRLTRRGLADPHPGKWLGYTASEIQFPREVVKRGYGAGRNRSDPYGRLLGLLLMALEDVVDAAEMGEHTNGGLAVVTEGFDDAVVLNAAEVQA